MTAQPLPDQFAADARWLVQALDPRARLARLVSMDADAYREASFLDDRMMAGNPAATLVSLDELVTAGANIKSDRAGWIFHIGHVGSTLLSRLLGELDGVLAIREPRALRDLTMTDGAEMAGVASALRRLMGRTFVESDLAIVKATSFVSEIAPHLIGADARALFLYAAPRNYVASILAGPNSTLELKALEEPRRQRLVRRGINLGSLPTDAHRAAAAWMTEMLSLEAAASAIGERARRFDFDQMLSGMGDALSQAAAHFGLAANPDRIRAVVEGPLMRRYSKAMEYDYSPDLRRELLAEAVWQHGRDIEQALAWLRDEVGRHAVTAPLATYLA